MKYAREGETSWAGRYSREELRDVQLGEPDVGPVLNWLERGGGAKPGLVLLEDEERCSGWVLVAPEALKQVILRECHDKPGGGAFGDG